jgi:hypothetical protein
MVMVNCGATSAHRLSHGLERCWIGKSGIGVLDRRTVNLYRSCARLRWLAQEIMRFILVRASED